MKRLKAEEADEPPTNFYAMPRKIDFSTAGLLLFLGYQNLKKLDVYQNDFAKNHKLKWAIIPKRMPDNHKVLGWIFNI